MRALTFVFLFTFLNFAQAKIDDSVDIFFPQSLKYLQYSQTEFSAFWWNFIIVDQSSEQQPNYAKAIQLCEKLKPQVGVDKEIDKILCGDDLSSFMPVLKAWAQDIVWREPAPAKNDLQSALQNAMTEVGFLSSVNVDLFQLKRLDPLDQWQTYLERNQTLASSQLKRQKGFLVDEKTHRIVIPVQFRLKPQMKNVTQTMDLLSSEPDISLVGAHASAYTNEKQVHEDMDIVSWVGFLVLVGFIGFLVFKGRVNALLLFIPVAAALGLASWVVQLIFGSIHGLTLAFGSGIVGLAVDYGLHGAFNSESKQTWKSNSIGFLTTLTGLVVMIMSGIPLIKQMMIFAVLGLFFGFMFFYFLCRFAPRYFTMKSLNLPLWSFKYSHLVIIVLILIGFASLFKTNLSFDLRKMNYQLAKDKAMTEWFFTNGEKQENFLLLRPQAEFSQTILEEKKWADENEILYVGLGNLWPASVKNQEQNLTSWVQQCTFLETGLNSSEKKVFAPFIENVCQSQKPLSYSELSQKLYSKHLIGDSGFLTILTAKNNEQAQKIKEKFPQANSLVESVKGFSTSLESDLSWMIPVVFLISTIILFIYYRSLTCVLTAYIPFFTGLGLFFLVNLLSGGELNLISVLGLIMVFGFSLDYGVFATDIYRFPQPGEDESLVYSALSLAAMSNIIGFFPMVFAKHPILHQLGMALFFGTIGTYLGTIWGIEKLYHWKKLL